MLTSGDVIQLDLGAPEGKEAGFRHPAVVVTAQRILDAQPNVIQVVPLTTTVRAFAAEVTIEPDSVNGLRNTAAAQCQSQSKIESSQRTRPILSPIRS